MFTGHVPKAVLEQVEVEQSADKYTFLGQLIDNAVHHNEPSVARARTRTMDDRSMLVTA